MFEKGSGNLSAEKIDRTLSSASSQNNKMPIVVPLTQDLLSSVVQSLSRPIGFNTRLANKKRKNSVVDEPKKKGRQDPLKKVDTYTSNY